MNFIKQIFGFSSEASKNQRCDGTQRQHYQYAPNSEDEEATSSRFPTKFYNDVGHAMDEEFIHNEQESVNDLREQFLKDGYKKPSQKHIQKVDEDISERMHVDQNRIKKYPEYVVVIM
ncbi:hypothetical protein NQ315_014423 [Exocentrus adspersus]|uniref:Uncharacterized protein n=1 Tax=Exocentrus adspersus TaxID=1586481 RepID=A0AAV8VBG2_9CUCU|nr:hypothetical protein NQ315_014423 [Exocentrus adspersus]